ncbi:hypothetical protein AVEN_254217-1 [Araneus ventricosus]|uniref:Uncharacterized protein n=1 Tax=Araneus ventricosus TaxID=182803 RepID=A0A4Y2JH11_ARAVE|nr:hypothetical protein AVEN_254217-1 [Araneus ventricosus]
MATRALTDSQIITHSIAIECENLNARIFREAYSRGVVVSGSISIGGGHGQGSPTHFDHLPWGARPSNGLLRRDGLDE